MATLEQIEEGIRRADEAGDSAGVKALAAERRRLLAGSQQSGQPSPAYTEALASMSEATQNPARGQYNALPAWQKPIVAASDIVQLAGSAPLMGWGEKAVAGIRAPFTDLTYEQELAEQRRLTEAARTRSGLAGTGAEIAGQVAALPYIAAESVPGMIGAGITEGAGYGAISAAGNDQDILTGAGIGAVGGGVGSALGKLLEAGGSRIGQAWRYFMAEPTDKARQGLYTLAQKMGLTADDVERAIVENGPETMGIDVLRKYGQGAGRAAANVSPAARETLETSLTGRKLGQNPRVAADVQRVAGVEPGSRQTVQDIIDARYAQRRGPIDTAYNEARAAGYDLPREPFRDILNTPMGKKAYDDAAASLLNRRGFQGDDAASELARLDQMKQELDSIASMAIRSGDNNRAAQATGLAKLLRERIDEAMSGGEYAKARALRQAAFKEQEAIQLGADVAAKPDIGAPAAVTGITSQPPVKAPATEAGQLFSQTDPVPVTGLRTGYAQQTANDLLGGTQSASALNRMSTPLAKETRQAVFGDSGAPTIENALRRERLFNEASNAITGNSTTARQLMEGLGIGGGAAGLDWVTGGRIPMLTELGTVAGLARAGATALPYLQRKLAARGTEAVAGETARILTANPRALPLERAIPPGWLESLSAALRDPTRRAVQFGGVNYANEPVPVR